MRAATTQRKAKPLKLTIPVPLEQEIKRDILTLLKYHRAVASAWIVNSGAATGEYTDASGNVKEQFVRFNTQVGHSDIAGVLKGGRALFFEVKRPGKNPTDLQQSFLDEMACAGALAACVHSVDEANAVLNAAVSAVVRHARFHSPYALDD